MYVEEEREREGRGGRKPEEGLKGEGEWEGESGG